jgi:hypothetical protein
MNGKLTQMHDVYFCKVMIWRGIGQRREWAYGFRNRNKPGYISAGDEYDIGDSEDDENDYQRDGE